MEMYKNKLAVAIKHNGKILRENKDIVHLPFGSEFSVLVKNLNSRRVKFALHIDGTDVLDGQEIIVNANSETEIKRFIRNGNMNEGNAFKFIERTEAIENGPRGVKVDDGIVRVEFWFEKEAPEVKTVIHKHYDEWHYPYTRKFWNGPYDSYGKPYDVMYGTQNSVSSLGNISNTSAEAKSIRDSVFRNASSLAQAASATSASLSATAQNAINDAGITVPGSKVEQKFQTVYGFISEAISNVIVLRLVGKVGKVEVVAPVTVKTKQKCPTCGKVNRATSKFCSGCGTALELL